MELTLKDRFQVIKFADFARLHLRQPSATECLCGRSTIGRYKGVWVTGDFGVADCLKCWHKAKRILKEEKP